MKPLRFNPYKSIIPLAGAILLLFGCSKEIETIDPAGALEPVSLDENAGNWNMIILNSPDQIAVAAPADVNSAAYQQELASIKTLQENLTNDQRKAIDYWKSGGIIRWNEIMRDLVARFNLPAAPVNDKTYPAPDPDNPFSDPEFPFSNPPYASRAYSYVCVGQYEALKAAWYYKFLYKRPSPAKTDNSIKALMPVTDLPAYPSEEAVMSAVSAEILKAMFPVAVEEITIKAGEQRNAALWSGKATASDLAAGVALGKAVAALVMARASTDGMKNAIGTPAIWQALADSATARGEIAWISLETPKRPPMLPLFGKVLGWNMTPQDIVEVRPGPPPSTSSDEMKAQLAEVKQAVNHLTREQLATVYKWADGAGTSCPPGHWNEIVTSDLRKVQFSEVRTARVFALLNMALHDACLTCWDTKYAYYNPRPSQLDPTIKTVTGLPNFPSYISGHSTYSEAAATVLSYLFPDRSQAYYSMADEAALSRLYGGIHYRADIEVGKGQGKIAGQHTVDYAKTDGAD